MTRNSYLKLEIRTRMERTGESYSAASRAVAKGEDLPEKSAEFPQRPFTPPTDEQRSSGLQDDLTGTTISGPIERANHLKALIIFIESAHALTYGTGLTFNRAMEILAPRVADKRLKEALLSVLHEVDHPDEFPSEDRTSAYIAAFERRPEIFPGVFTPVLATAGAIGLMSIASVYRTELELL